MPRKKKSSSALPTLADSDKNDLERRLGYIFQDPNLLWEALQAAGNGVRQIGDRKIDDGNKKMAMLGDTVLKLALLQDWFGTGESRFTGHKMQSTIGSNAHLDRCGRAAGLEKYINKNHTTKGNVPKGTMSAAVEALIGAVFVDSGESLRAVKIAIKGLGLLDDPEGGGEDGAVEILRRTMKGLGI